MTKREKRSRCDIDGASCIKDKNGNIMLGQDDIKVEWEAYFKNLLNEKNPINVDFHADAVSGPIELVNIEEVKAALKFMKKGKVPGPSQVTTDMLTAAGEENILILHDIYKEVWRKGEIPDDWGCSSTIPLYKGKGDPLTCASYRGIRLLEHCLKILEKIIYKRLMDNLTIVLSIRFHGW